MGVNLVSTGSGLMGQHTEVGHFLKKFQFIKINNNMQLAA